MPFYQLQSMQSVVHGKSCFNKLRLANILDKALADTSAQYFLLPTWIHLPLGENTTCTKFMNIILASFIGMVNLFFQTQHRRTYYIPAKELDSYSGYIVNYSWPCQLKLELLFPSIQKAVVLLLSKTYRGLLDLLDRIFTFRKFFTRSGL